MPANFARLFSVCLLIVVISGCTFRTTIDNHTQGLSITPISSPSGTASGMSSLELGRDGRLYLSWVQRNDDGSSRLLFSRREGHRWSPVQEIASGDDWFVNWADFPAIAIADRDHMIASWLQKTAGGTYAYDIRLATSSDAGGTWSTAFPAHDDTSPTEHGFVSLVPLSHSRYGAVWLDGREMIVEDGPMTLRFGEVDTAGVISHAQLLDGRICECCQTSMTVTGDQTIVVAYRGRSATEVRNILITRRVDGTWTTPQPAHDDGWEIAGCPVNGPAISASGVKVALAWFTMGSTDEAAVNVAFSNNHGATFNTPIRIDIGDPEGRVDILFQDESSVLVTWLETHSAKASDLLIRRVSLDGTMSPVRRVARLTGGRSIGFPRMGTNGRETILSWTDPGDPSEIRTAVVSYR